MVTGATSGIGLAAAEQLAQRGASVLGVGRSAERCTTAAEKLRSSSGQARYLLADLSLQAEVRRLAEVVRSQVAALDGLINNAGAFTFSRSETAEGIETQWAVNHLAPFLLTLSLLPLLRAAPAARVVTVSSGSHYHTRLHWGNLQLRRGYNGLLAYKQTKLCNVLFTAELNRRLGPDSRVRAFAADPGLVFTEMGFKGNPWLVRLIWGWRRRGGVPPEESARGVIFLATEPSIQNASEIYWKDGAAKAPNPYALDPKAARRLWQVSEALCGIR